MSLRTDSSEPVRTMDTVEVQNSEFKSKPKVDVEPYKSTYLEATNSKFENTNPNQDCEPERHVAVQELALTEGRNSMYPDPTGMNPKRLVISDRQSKRSLRERRHTNRC